MITAGADIQQIHRDFEWAIPDFYNIGIDVCDRWAELSPDKLAIIDIHHDQTRRDYTFSDLRSLSNQLAHALRKKGVACSQGHPDRVGILLPQCVETLVSHLAVFKLGAISIPLFTLFGADALLHRLKDSSAKVLITNAEGLATIEPLREQLPALEVIISIDDVESDSVDGFYSIIADEKSSFDPVKTSADHPALLIYTSGTTGNPKGALHAHRVLLGHLPGVEISHNFLPKPDDRFWTPADWAWIGGLLDVLMPALHHGIPVVAYRFKKFDPLLAVELMRTLAIRNVFLPPTALKMLKALPETQFSGLDVRSIGSGGETLGTELVEWGKRVFNTTINEFYGQTECNMVVSSCSIIEEPEPGCMGRAVPGHVVKIINAQTGIEMPDEEEGAIAVLSPNPVMFLRYWNNPKASAEKFVEGPDGRWLLTGDRGARNPSGRIRFIGRDDDVIASSGYRIGPAEVENTLVAHPAVQMAGVVGKPDELRGHIVVAFVTLKPGMQASDSLSIELSAWVKQRLAAHEYPREITFLDDMPMTTTGKIIRSALRDRAVASEESV